MERFEKKRRISASPRNIEEVLESYYEQLLEWSLLLSRGDRSQAEEIVQELCLHFSLAKPDLSAVANLDGYLYISLRNLYLSNLSRAARESAQLVRIADFDSAEFALAAGPSSDALQRQNDLLRICNYAVWRKDTSKSSSYFTLHFFHGYHRREVAAIARVPMSAIYNKLKTARTEIGNYLATSNRPQLASHDRPPVPHLLLSPASPIELFNIIRTQILDARHSACLAEPELLVYYKADAAKSIPCELLSHIVSCERCLEIVTRSFGMPMLEDRAPLDILSGGSGVGTEEQEKPRSYRAFQRTLERRRTRIYEHRPEKLSIAVNGKISASRDVQSYHNTLSSRIEKVDVTRFVEIFSEQQVRLAFLPVQKSPPAGPHVYSERIELSDERSLELTLRFDALGLQCEVAYIDPTLASNPVDAETADEEISIINEGIPALRQEPKNSPLERLRKFLTVRPTWAWALVLVLVLAVSLGGYFTDRLHMARSANATAILNRSIQSERVLLAGHVEQQVVKIDVVDRNGSILTIGNVSRMRDGSGDRAMTTLYGVDHQIMASEWHTEEKTGITSMPPNATVPQSEKLVLTSDLWKQDLSTKMFATLADGDIQMRITAEGYELRITRFSSGHSQFEYAVLELDHNLHPVRQILRMRLGQPVREIRYVERSYRTVPSATVSDREFLPDPVRMENMAPLSRPSSHSMPQLSGRAQQLARLQIGILYQLSQLNADVGVPLEVVKTADERVRIAGTLPDSGRTAELERRLRSLPDGDLIDFRLISGASLPTRSPHGVRSQTMVYSASSSVLPIKEKLRQYFLRHNVAAENIDAAVLQFSRQALDHAEHSLQDAYALNRLGQVIMQADPASLDEPSRKQWMEMVQKHAADLAAQMQALQGQLLILSSTGERTPSLASQTINSITDPQRFGQTTDRLLQETRQLEKRIGEIFANGQSANMSEDVTSQINTVLQLIPENDANKISAFARQLSSSNLSAEDSPRGPRSARSK